MPNVLKGNFKTQQTVDTKDAADKTLEEKFENAALKRLGGSIAFVSKRKVMWGTDDTKKKKK